MGEGKPFERPVPRQRAGASVSRRLALAFVVVGVALALLVATNYISLLRQQQELNRITTEFIPELRSLATLRELAVRLPGLTYDYLLWGDAETLERLEETAEMLGGQLERYASLGRDSVEWQENVAGLSLALGEVESSARTLIALQEGGAAASELQLAVWDLEASVLSLQDLLTEVTSDLEMRLETLETGVATMLQRAFLLTVFLPLLLLVGLVIYLFLTTQSVVRPLREVTAAAAQMHSGSLDQRVSYVAEDEIGFLGRVLNSLMLRIRGLVGTLEESHEQSTRRGIYLQLVAEVAREAATVPDQDEFLNRAISLISERLGTYHVGVFLLDSAGEWAVLKGAHSRGGQQMVAQGYRVQVREDEMIGYVLRHGLPRRAFDVGKDAVTFDYPDLPDTRSQVALPLRARGTVIGVLDVQSTRPEAFDEENITLLQALADQMALALSNAQLFARAQASLEAERLAYAQVSREAWLDLLQSERIVGYQYAGDALHVLEGSAAPAERHNLPAEKALSAEKALPEIEVPLQVRGSVIGKVVAHKPSDAVAWTEAESALMQTLVDQLEVALEGARLFEETRHRAAQEQLVGEVMGQVRETLDLERMVRTAADELRPRLGLERLVIRLGTPDGQETLE